ncbi:MAG: T9SS type A sorting domain-containing protein, partial [Saprospiraceae bacterium]|nr:T9SS type A sorting domain-containing protein [Saprospiraceae bacterium]
SDISMWLSDLNALFLPYNIQFFECGTRELFVNSTLFNFDITEEPQLTAYDIPHVVNVYVFGTVTSGGQGIGGYSYLPPSSDRIVLSKAGGNLFNNKVFLHEVGHYFGLYHTHGKTNNGTTDEWANGGNCLIAGDDVCDTDADPNLFSNTQNCQYIGTVLDQNGHPFTPDPGNHMSYAPANCRVHFSVGQMNRMAYSVLNDRAYLLGCVHPSGCDQPITELPVVFNFENGLDGWINKSYEGYGDFVDMLHATGPVAPNTTGPEQAFSGVGYLYFDAASSDPYGSWSTIISPCIDLRGVASPKMTFRYHAFGAEIGELGIQVSTDGGHTYQGPQPDNTLFYSIGDQGDQWLTATCDLNPYKSAAALQIRLVVSGGPLGQFAVDSVAVYNDPNACSLSVNANTQHISCHGNDDGELHLSAFGNFTPPVSYQWSNGATTADLTGLAPGLYYATVTSANGCSSVATLPVLSPNYLYATTTQTNVNVYGQSTGSINADANGGLQPYTWLWSNGATSADISGLAAGVYTVTVTDRNDCSTVRTATITQPVITCSSYQTVFPWTSSIDQNLGIFVQETGNDHFNWTRQSGGTPTQQTGPDGAYHGSHYWYTRASGGNAPNKSAFLKTSKCLTLGNMTNPVFEFYYHMYGNQMGSLSVEISMDNEQNWVSVWSMSGNQGNQWRKAIIDLLPYKTDHTKIRIKGVTGVGSRSDMAIDALYIGEAGSNQYLPETAELRAPGMTVYPNPTSGWFELRMDEGLVCDKAEIFNAAGQLIWAETTSSSWLQFDLSGQTPGCYYLRVQSGVEVKLLKLMLL